MKMNQLTSQFAELSQTINDKLENNASHTLKNIKSMFFENSQPDSNNTPKTHVSGGYIACEKFKFNQNQKLICSCNDNLTDD
ncbi:Hypothetical protein CINCED_3A003404 [Cinara cedri]|uniref:Uncharacterized protein n=1 Tax=Cinara cedri TaxID=506608 RepID=A0A5E4N5T0_9HEMI|nr:Hypothetical protein CINCED_3A003404 [Cinara cedri]